MKFIQLLNVETSKIVDIHTLISGLMTDFCDLNIKFQMIYAEAIPSFFLCIASAGGLVFGIRLKKRKKETYICFPIFDVLHSAVKF